MLTCGATCAGVWGLDEVCGAALDEAATVVKEACAFNV